MKSPRDALRISIAAFAMIGFAIGFQTCSTVGNGGTGAVGEVKGNVQDIDQRAQSVFKDMHIQMVSADTQDSGHQRDIAGMSGEEKVSVLMISSGDNVTHVEVNAKKGVLGWDKDLANQVLSKIVQG